MEKEGFIYLWFDKKRKMYYVGCHWGTENDPYICSSRWMKKTYKRRPQDFKRRIIQRGIEKKVLKEQEVKWLALIKTEELGKRYYNLTKILTGNGWKKGKPRSEETKKRVSDGLKRAYENGYEPWNKGKPITEETRQKVREAAKRQHQEGRVSKETCFKAGETSWNKGIKGFRKVSDEEREHKRKIAKLRYEEGKFGNKGRSWFTDGTTNVMLLPDEDVPCGFYKGRVFNV